jgi:protein phosphatase
MQFDVSGCSAQGPRAENQDAFSVDAFAGHGLLAVADGMGGERAGRLAADTALNALMKAEIRSLDAARYAIRHADESVARMAQEAPDERAGMGCALALMVLTLDRAGQPGWVGAHVGDVRILSRSPDATIRLETRDHTPAYARWEAGEIALDEIPDSPGANRLQRAVGRGGEAEASWIPVRPGWTYLLVSDGVTKAMRLDELGDAMGLSSSTDICAAVMRKVEERGPDDNYTAVAVRVLDAGADGPTLPTPPRAVRQDAPLRAAAAPLPEDDDVTRRSSPLPLMVALLALALAAFAAWRSMQPPPRDPAADARVDSLRSEVRALRARAATGDSVPVLGADSAAPAAAPAQPAAGAPAPAPRTTQP